MTDKGFGERKVSSKGMYISPFPFGKSPGGNLANLWFTLRNIADITPNRRYIRSTADINELSEIVGKDL